MFRVVEGELLGEFSFINMRPQATFSYFLFSKFVGAKLLRLEYSYLIYEGSIPR